MSGHNHPQHQAHQKLIQCSELTKLLTAKVTKSADCNLELAPLESSAYLAKPKLAEEGSLISDDAYKQELAKQRELHSSNQKEEISASALHPPALPLLKLNNLLEQEGCNSVPRSGRSEGGVVRIESQEDWTTNEMNSRMKEIVWQLEKEVINLKKQNSELRSQNTSLVQVNCAQSQVILKYETTHAFQNQQQQETINHLSCRIQENNQRQLFQEQQTVDLSLQLKGFARTNDSDGRVKNLELKVVQGKKQAYLFQGQVKTLEDRITRLALKNQNEIEQLQNTFGQQNQINTYQNQINQKHEQFTMAQQSIITKQDQMLQTMEKSLSQHAQSQLLTDQFLAQVKVQGLPQNYAQTTPQVLKQQLQVDKLASQLASQQLQIEKLTRLNRSVYTQNSPPTKNSNLLVPEFVTPVKPHLNQNQHMISISQLAKSLDIPDELFSMKSSCLSTHREVEGTTNSTPSFQGR